MPSILPNDLRNVDELLLTVGAHWRTAPLGEMTPQSTRYSPRQRDGAHGLISPA